MTLMRSRNEYSLPVKKGSFSWMSSEKSPAHKGKLKNAIDFKCRMGTPVFAALDGKVVYVKDNSNIGGPSEKYLNDGNRIAIKHRNREYSAYEHLRYKGCIVKIGQKVKEGQLIGYSGNTGYSFGPHLHFEVFVFTGSDVENDYQTIKIRFKNLI